MTRSRHLLPALIFAQLLACHLIGCGADNETQPSDARESAPPEASQELPAAAEPEQEALPPGQIPDDFPADVPQYPGAAVAQSFSVPNDSLFVAYTTSASTQEVFEFYQEQLKNHGWTLSETNKKTNRLTATKEGRTASIIVFASGANTEIGVSIKSE